MLLTSSLLLLRLRNAYASSARPLDTRLDPRTAHVLRSVIRLCLHVCLSGRVHPPLSNQLLTFRCNASVYLTSILAGAISQNWFTRANRCPLCAAHLVPFNPASIVS